MLYSALTFPYFVILLFVHFIPKCVTWDFGDISNRIHAVCRLKCDFNLVSFFFLAWENIFYYGIIIYIFTDCLYTHKNLMILKTVCFSALFRCKVFILLLTRVFYFHSFILM